MILKNAVSENGTEQIKLPLTLLAGTSTLVIPDGAVVNKVWYKPTIASDNGGFTVTIDGSGTDIVIGTASAGDAAQTTHNIVWVDGWEVGAGQAGVLKATATSTPTAGSGTLYALFTRATQA